MPVRHLTRYMSAIVGATLLLALGLAGASAQDTPSTPTLDQPERGLAYPVSIHRGICDDLVLQPVGPAIEAGVAGWQPGAEVSGVTAQGPVLVAEADYDGTIEHFIETPHVIAIHESSEDYGTIIACGEIAGYVDDNKLIIPLRGDDSPLSGVAIISENTTIVEEALELVDESLAFDHASIHLTVYIVPAEES